MKWVCVFFLLVWLSAPMLSAQPSRVPSLPSFVDPERAGQEIAAKLRSAVPAEASEFSGLLLITTRDGHTNLVPVTSRISINKSNWQVIYLAGATAKTRAEQLAIVHAPEGPNRYFLTIGTNSPSNGTPTPVKRDELSRPFVASDFSLMDLGLEFLHWPGQRIIKSEMRRSRACRVLESTNVAPAVDGYARVLSWIDVETDGIIRAEAYDRQNKLVKEFVLGSFRKVEGRWQLQNMKIRSTKTNQETELKFDLERK